MVMERRIVPSGLRDDDDDYDDDDDDDDDDAESLLRMKLQ